MDSHPQTAGRGEAPAAGIDPASLDGEQRIVIHGVSWKDYCVVRELLDSPGLPMTYLEGALELMTPSPLYGLIRDRLRQG